MRHSRPTPGEDLLHAYTFEELPDLQESAPVVRRSQRWSGPGGVARVRRPAAALFRMLDG